MGLATVPSNHPLVAALRRCRLQFLSAAAFSALLNLLFLAPTLYMLQVYDRALPARSGLTLLFLTGVLAFALLTLSALDALRARLFVRVSVRLDRLLAGAVLDSALARPHEGGEVIARQAMREFDILRQVLTSGGLMAVFDSPWIPVYLLVCFLLNPLLGLMVLVGGALLLGITWLNERSTKNRLQRAAAASNRAYLSQEQSAASADVLRALGMRRAMVARHLAERAAAGQMQADASFATSGFLATTKFIRLFLQSLALGVGAWLAIKGKLSAGSIFAASFLIARALAPLESILGAWKSLGQARRAWDSLYDLLQRPAVTALTALPPPEGAIEADRLVVMKPRGVGAILQGVSFKVAAGEVVAVIGPSGAGKSTLMRALAGAAGVYGGAIRFDGAEMRDYDPERLALRIGYLPQDTTLFSGTVKENIARFANYLGQDSAMVDEAAVAAAKACGMHDMILHLEDGYDTMLSLGGRGLSAGQAQGVALARALFGAPKLLLLDEPNAHLDAEGETRLLETLREQKSRGVTAMIVAHRTGVLAAVDRLMFMRDGRIEMFGPRDEVLARLSGAVKPHPAANRAQFL
ncbi:MAG TPA: type I secretion system permease/ATPase [Caulobacteraceae bacterium]|nr:type I secretion system permease/ATPase [Caulobacteraceae bacterium]